MHNRVSSDAVRSLSVDGGGCLGDLSFQERANQSIVRIIPSFEEHLGVHEKDHIGTGFLFSLDGYGYIASCAHIFKKGKPNFAVSVVNPIVGIGAAKPVVTPSRDLILSQGDMDRRFGSAIINGERDLALIPVLDPSSLCDAGYLFVPIERHVLRAKPVEMAVSGFPFPSEWGLQRTDRGFMWRGDVDRPRHILEDEEKVLTRQYDVAMKFPSATFGFPIAQRKFTRDPVWGRLLQFPHSVGGMSGGPVWGRFHDNSVKLIGVLAVEANPIDRPDLAMIEVYGVAINVLLEMLPCSICWPWG